MKSVLNLAEIWVTAISRSALLVSTHIESHSVYSEHSEHIGQCKNADKERIDLEISLALHFCADKRADKQR